MGLLSDLGNGLKGSILQKEGEVLLNDWQVVRQNIERLDYRQREQLETGCLSIRYEAWQRMKNMTKVGIAQTAVALKQDGKKLANLDVVQSTCLWMVGGWMQSYFGETVNHQQIHEHMSDLLESWRLRLSMNTKYRDNAPLWLSPLR